MLNTDNMDVGLLNKHLEDSDSAIDADSCICISVIELNVHFCVGYRLHL